MSTEVVSTMYEPEMRDGRRYNVGDLVKGPSKTAPNYEFLGVTRVT